MVVQQVLGLGQKLIELHQVAHIPQLLLLAGEAAACAGGDFLRVMLSAGVAYAIQRCYFHDAVSSFVENTFLRSLCNSWFSTDALLCNQSAIAGFPMSLCNLTPEIAMV